jgi:hypothetical protein
MRGARAPRTHEKTAAVQAPDLARRLLAVGMVQKRAHLTVSPEKILDGQLCACPACKRDGQHEPDCAVHDEPIGGCSCGRTEQSKAAG